MYSKQQPCSKNSLENSSYQNRNYHNINAFSIATPANLLPFLCKKESHISRDLTKRGRLIPRFAGLAGHEFIEWREEIL